MELAVYNIEGEDTGKKVQLNDAAFGIEPNDHAIYLAVKQYMANKRQGTHKTKERAEIKGSTRKLKKQKGTGTARAGSIKSPIFRGGGRVFGPRPKDYSFKLNKKVKKLARNSALSYKAKENNIIVIEDFEMEKPKTKQLLEITQNLEISHIKSLFLLGQPSKNLYLASRNLQQTSVKPVYQLNTYDVLSAAKLIIAESSIDELNKMHQ